MGDLLELAARVEALEGPCREVDCLIHLALFGGHTGEELGLAPNSHATQFYTHPGTGHGHLSPLPFTGSVETAEMILSLAGDSYPEWQITRRLPTGYHASIAIGPDGVGCETPALALTAAALRARTQASGGASE